MVFGAFAGGASAKKISKAQKAKITKQLRKQIKKNPRAIRSKKFLRRAALVNFKLPVTIRLRSECPAGSGGVASCPNDTPGTRSNTALNERGAASATVDLGPSLGQRTVALRGSLAAEVQFRDSYDGGALGNVSIEILPSNTKTINTNSVPLLWNPDVDSLSSRTDANFARAFIRSQGGPPVPPGATPQFALYANGWENKLQGCREFKDTPTFQTANAPDGVRTYHAAAAGGQGPTDPGGTYSALWYGSGLPLLGGTPGFGVMDTAGPGGTTQPSYYLPVFPGIDSLDNLIYGTAFPTTGDYPLVDPDEYLGPQPNPFPYPSIDPDPSFSDPDFDDDYDTNGDGVVDHTDEPSDPTIAGNARDVVLRTNSLDLSIASAGTMVDLATGTPTPNQSFPSGQGSQNIIIGKSGGEANLFGNIPGKEYGIDVTVSLATRINSIFRIQDQDVFDTPLEEHEEYPAGIFNCRQIWSGAVQNFIPGIRLTGNLRISPAITKDGKLRIAKASVNTQQPDHVALSACLMPYQPYGTDPTTPVFPTTPGTGDAGPAWTAPVIPDFSEAAPDLIAPYNVLAYNSDQLPGENRRGATPSNVMCNSWPHPLVRASSLYGTVAPMVAADALNGYTTTASGAQATVAGDIKVNALKVDVLIGDQ
jgi:hypothetical protein